MKQKIIALLSVLACSVSFANMHCEASFQGKPFFDVAIAANPTFGPVHCTYKNLQDKETIEYKLAEDFYKVSGNWRSAMPGTQWCGLETGGTFDSCMFAKREG